MAITNYGELKVAVANWLARDDLTARVPELIALGEFRLYSELRVRFMEASANVTVSGGAQTAPLPTRYVQARDVYISGAPIKRLEYKTPVEFRALHHSRAAGKPDVFTIIGENFVWGPSPDIGYTAICDFYQKPAALAADADTNGLFALVPNLLLYAALLEAAPFVGNDARVSIWASMYEDLLMKVHAADARDRHSGDTRTAMREAQRT
jgi:hypothetical protein